MKLFREEVQQAQAAQWMGTVRLSRPLSFAVVTGAAIALGGLFVMLATFGEVNRKARLSGLLVPVRGSLNITAPQAGVVAERRIAEGQFVHAGQVLLVLNTERQSAAGDTAALIAQQIQARQLTLQSERAARELQTRQREQALTDRIRSLEAELRQSDEEVGLQQRRVQLAEKTVNRYQQLANNGFVADIQSQAKQEELIDANARAQSLQRNRTALQRDRQSLVAERLALQAQLQTELAQLQRSVAVLDQESTENATRRSVFIVAPEEGTVTALNLQPGQAVQGGQALATLVPHSRGEAGSQESTLEAHLYAPSHTAGFVQPGQTVYLRYAAYPYQKFGLHKGRIRAVSATPFAPSELPPNIAQQITAQVGSNEALYRVNVDLDEQTIRTYGQLQALKPGLTLEADVMQERRKVWEWVLEPVLAASSMVKVLNTNPNKVVPGG